MAEKQFEANDALQMITDTMRNANTQKGHMEELKGKTLQEEKDLNRSKHALPSVNTIYNISNVLTETESIASIQLCLY